jgi:aspartyl-tRNA(Asn)/glutamyl-tRNA(Gln) amidotransferase subunit B
MRSKEGSADYRYFSDPDLPNMILGEIFIEEIKNNLPKLPSEKRNDLIETGLDLEQANILGKSDSWIVEIYFEVFSKTKEHASTYNWITGELQGQMRKLDINSLPEWFSAELLSEIIELIKDNKISFTSGKTILSEILQKNISVDEVATNNDLYQENNEEKIVELVKKVINDSEDIVQRIKEGEDKLVGFLVGQVIKNSGGSVNPGIAKELLSKELKLQSG